jgi:hypothetical protein
MTYAFYLPPMCDPYDGHLLLGENIKQKKKGKTEIYSFIQMGAI